jgi:hypothetical protein
MWLWRRGRRAANKADEQVQDWTDPARRGRQTLRRQDTPMKRQLTGQTGRSAHPHAATTVYSGRPSFVLFGSLSDTALFFSSHPVLFVQAAPTATFSSISVLNGLDIRLHQLTTGAPTCIALAVPYYMCLYGHVRVALGVQRGASYHDSTSFSPPFAYPIPFQGQISRTYPRTKIWRLEHSSTIQLAPPFGLSESAVCPSPWTFPITSPVAGAWPNCGRL